MVVSELRGRSVLVTRSSALDEVTFAHVLADVARELDFQQSQVRLIQTQLEICVATVSFVEIPALRSSLLTRRKLQARDLINLRNSRTMEKMTARTILEAQSVRIIAVVTMFFLPPTFVSVSQVKMIVAERMKL